MKKKQIIIQYVPSLLVGQPDECQIGANGFRSRLDVIESLLNVAMTILDEEKAERAAQQIVTPGG